MKSVSIVAVSGGDQPASDAIDVLAYLVGLNLCVPFIVVDIDEIHAGDTAEIDAQFVTEHGREDVGLNKALAILGSLDRVRLVAATTRTTRSVELDQLAANVTVLSTWVRNRVQHPIVVTQARLAVPIRSDIPDIEPFFGPKGTVNLIALGEDELAVGAVPLKADAFTPQQQAAHVAFEVATAAGLWTGMESAPIDNWDFDAGAGDPATHLAFVSSAARVVVDSSPDAREALSIRGELPIPSGFTFVPPFDAIEDDIVDAVYPPGLAYQPSDRIDETDGSPSVSLGAVLKELVRLPAYALRSVREDLSKSGKESMRQILMENGFEDVTLSDDDGDDSGLLTKDDIDAIIASAEREARRPRPDPIPGEYWNTMITGILGMIDGAPEAADIRARVSDERQVLTDQSRIVVPGTDVEATGLAITAAPKPAPTSTKKKDNKKPKKETPATETEASTDVPKKEAANAAPSGKSRKRFDRETVLTKIGARIRSTINDADTDFNRTARRMRDTAQGLAEWQQLEIIAIVPWILALGAFLLAFSIGALTPLRSVVQLDYFDGSLRSILFAAASALLIVLSGLAIIGRSGQKWQGYATFGAVLLGIAAGILAAYWDIVSDSTTDEIGAVIAVLVVIMTVVGFIRAKDAGDDATARVLRTVGLLYLAAIAIVAGARADLYFQENFSESQTRLFVALVIGAIVTAIAVSIIVAVARVRQQSAIGSASDAFEYHRTNLARAADASRRLGNALGQWAYTGTSMNYLVQYPFGKAEPRDRSLDALKGVGLLRFRLLALEMSNDGRRSLLASLLVASTAPGWLSRQYELAVKEFTEREARINGLPEAEADKFLPDESEIPLSLDSPESVKGRSPRVRFARWLNTGDADPILANPIESDDLVNSYRKVLSHAPSYRLRPLGDEPFNEDLTVAELFRSIIPNVPRYLPQYVIPGNLFSADDPEQRLLSMVWWPQTFAMQPTDASDHLTWNPSVPSTSAEGGSQVVLQTIRFDRSRSFPFHEMVRREPEDRVEHEMPDDVM